MTVAVAAEFFAEEPHIGRSLQVLQEGGLGYLRLWPVCHRVVSRRRAAGEARHGAPASQRGETLYILDEPITGLHPSDIERLQRQLHTLVEAGNTVIMIEHDMRGIASSDWVIDVGPEARDEGGHIIAQGPPERVARVPQNKTARLLAAALAHHNRITNEKQDQRYT